VAEPKCKNIVKTESQVSGGMVASVCDEKEQARILTGILGNKKHGIGV